MAQRRRRRSKRWVYWLFILLLLVAAVAVCYLVWDAYFRDKEDLQDIPDSSEIEEKKEQRGEPSESEAEFKSESVEKKKVEQYDGGNPNEAEELSGAITYAGVSGSNLMIRVNIDQYLEEGSCSLTLARSGATIYNSIASVIGGPSTSSCEGFDVPVSGLGGGKIEITIKLEANGRSGTIRGEANI